MKFVIITSFTMLLSALLIAQDDAGFVGLSDIAVENLGIESVEVFEATFEESFFAIGRIAPVPNAGGVVSSRIPGRIVELNFTIGDTVKKGDVVAKVESRLPGNPPPTVEMKAPLAGLITESHVRIGEPVEPDKEMLDIVDLSRVQAIARIPEDRAGKIKIGTVARIRIPAAPGKGDIEGKLIRFGTAANSESGTIDAYFEIENSSGRIRPGMRAEFSVVTDIVEDVMSVPREALQGDPTDRFVFVRKIGIENGFEKAAVVVGRQNDNFIEIKRGLFAGDEVVTKGSYPLAFAGGGGVSLKEALDAAHGHEHNEDGSEMTAEDKARKAAEAAEASGGGGKLWNSLTLFFAATSALLLVLMVAMAITKKREVAVS